MVLHGDIGNEDIDHEGSDHYIRDEWAGWNAAQREADLKELFISNTGSWYGARLRDMRSTIVEEYLARDST